MKIKIEYFKWLDNKPIITEFEGTKEEFNMLLKIGYIIPNKNDIKKELVGHISKL